MELTRRTLHKLVASSVLAFPPARDSYNPKEKSWHLERISEDSEFVRIVFTHRRAVPPEEVDAGVVVGGVGGQWTVTLHDHTESTTQTHDHADLWLALHTAHNIMQDVEKE